jgi:hypothetical protein
VFQRNDGDDAGRWVGQTSVRELRHPDSGVAVVLLSLVHIGRVEYYRSLTPHLRDAEVVLAEGTGGQPAGKRMNRDELPAEGLWVRRYQAACARILGLQEQHDWEVSVVDDRWRLADMNSKQLFQAMGRMTELSKEAKAATERLEGLLAGSPAPEELARARDEVAGWWTSEFANATAIQGDPLSEKRERVMWGVIKERISSHEHKRVALVFGAWHAYNLEPKLVNDLGFRVEATCWHDCMIFERPTAPEKR